MQKATQAPRRRRTAVGATAALTALWLLVAAVATASPGDPVPGFGTNGAITSDFKWGHEEAQGVALMDDGRILVAGAIDAGYAIVRLMPDGSPDYSFGTGGAVTVFDSPTETFRPTDMVVMPDGKIVMAGNSVLLGVGTSRIAVARHNANGSPDTTFGGDGMVALDFGASSNGNSVALDDSGKVLVGGTSFGTPVSAALARLNPNGSLDASFGTGGQALFGTISGANDMAIDDAGKVVIAGETGSDFAAARVNADGSLDAGFGTGGVSGVDMTGGADFADTLVLKDGSVVVGGWAGAYSGGNLGLARFDGTGTLDPSFGTGGKTVSDLGASETISEMVALADGKIAVTGFKNVFEADLLIARYSAGGTLDASFGTGGAATLGAGAHADGRAIVQQGDGKLVVAGLIGEDLGVARFNTNGTLDTSFGGSFQAGAASAAGYTRIRLPGGSDTANAVARQGDGKLITAGTVGRDVAVARYHIDGSPDVSFGAGGKVITDVQRYDEGADVALQSDGKIVVAGTAGQDEAFLLIRYNPDGSLDTSFGSGGSVVTPGTDDKATGHAVALQDDGKILVGGRTGFWDENFAVVRYNPDGSLDATFGNGGITETDFDGVGREDEVYDLAVLPGGKILAAGTVTKESDYNNDFALARYDADGSPDSSFSSDGKLTLNLGGEGELRSLVALPGGGVLGVGFDGASGNILAAQVDGSGALDTAFSGDGKAIVPLEADAEVHGAALQADGKIVVTGYTGYSTASNLVVARLDGATGALDASFASGGVYTRDFQSKADEGNAVIVLPDTSIVAAGYATLHDTSSDFALVRIEGDDPPATPTSVPGTQRLWGDADCNNAVNSVDSLKVSRHVAALSVAQTEPCPDVGSTVDVTDASEHKWGDTDCDNDVDSVDALKLLRHVAALPVAQSEPCPDVGIEVLVAD